MSKYQSQFSTLFFDLNTSLNNYQEKIAKNFLNAFQSQILKLHSDIAQLKEQELQSNEQFSLKFPVDGKNKNKSQFLQDTLEWLKKESIRLTEKNIGQKKEIQLWKNKAETLEKDVKFLEVVVKKSRKVIKQLNYKLSQCDWEDAKGEIDDPSLFKEISSYVPMDKTTFSPMEKYDDHTMIFNKTQTEIYQPRNNKTSQAALVLKDTLSSENMQTIDHQDMGSKTQDFRVNKIISSQKRQIEYLKRKLKSVTQLKVSNVQHSSELEKLFMGWVEEVKKEVTKRRSLSSVRTRRDAKGMVDFERYRFF